MRLSSFALSCLVFTACTPYQTISADPKVAGNVDGIVQIDLGDLYAYVIDRRTESCFLRLGTPGMSVSMVAVDCAKLKRNTPEAREFITWEAESPALAPATDPAVAPQADPKDS